MYKTLKTKLSNIQDTLNKAEENYKDPQIVIITKLDNGKYKITESYYNALNGKLKSKVKIKEYITDNYKKEVEKYTENKTRVIINDLI